jgi:N-acetylglucosamine kinase-like BadF-type ATPase
MKILVDVGGTNIRVYRNNKPLVRRPRAGGGPDSLVKQIKASLVRLDSRLRGNDGLTIGMRGVWTPAEKKKWAKKFRGLAARVEVISDVELAHRRAFGDGPGILLNAGTGSIAFGRAPNGKTARAGGLGPYLGDEGSAFWLGREYLKRMADWKKARAYAVGENPVAKIASLAPRALKRYPQLAKEARRHLMALVTDVKRQLNWKGKCRIALQGGVFKESLMKTVFAAVVSLSLVLPSAAFASTDQTQSAPMLLAMGTVVDSPLTFHPDPSVQYAAADNLNLDELGFNKSDTSQDPKMQKLLNRRTKLLKAHQLFGLATGVAMALALSQASGTGAKGEAGKAAREDHEKYGLATGALYLTTASLMWAAPKVPGQKLSGRTKLHRALAFIHFPAMLATAYLGITDKKKLDRGDDPSGLKPAAGTIAAVSFYTALAVMVVPFGGK